MRSFIRSMNFFVLLTFVGIPALGTASATVPGSESLDHPLAGWNSILLGLGNDQLRSATENILGRGAEELIPDKHSRPTSDPEDELARFVSQMMMAGCLQACPGLFYTAVAYSPLTSPPSNPEDELAEFVSRISVAECFPVWPMQFYGAVTFSSFKIQSPFRFRGRIGHIR